MKEYLKAYAIRLSAAIVDGIGVALGVTLTIYIIAQFI